MLAESARDQVVQRPRKIVRLFQFIRKLAQRVRDDRVDDDVRPRDGECRPQHAELEFIACKGKRRSAVAVGGVLGQFGESIYPQLHDLAAPALVLAVVFQRLDDCLQLLAEVHRHDGGRRLVRAQAVIVARARHGQAQQILVVVHRLYDGGEEEHKLAVFGGGRAGIEQVQARIRAHRPVVVLARAR